MCFQGLELSLTIFQGPEHKFATFFQGLELKLGLTGLGGRLLLALALLALLLLGFIFRWGMVERSTLVEGAE